MVGDWRRQAYSVAQFRRLAQRALPRPVFDFSDGGAEDEVTLRANEAAFAQCALLPRPLYGAATRDLAITLFGQRLSMPLMIGPTGLSGLFWPDGELAAARAAKNAGTAFCLSHGSACTIEDLAATGVSPRWMQVFLYRDRGLTETFVRRAAEAGYQGLVLTIDNQILSQRERDLRNGFTIPPRFGPFALAGMATKLGWLRRMGPRLPGLTFANYPLPEGEGGSGLAQVAARFQEILDPGLSWPDVDWLRGIWQGPLLIKGILHPEEARRAVDHGVDGLIVSNHGGRQLDGAVASLTALPGVVSAVEGRLPVLLDGGVRRGVDVLRALALGATACLIARPQLWALSVAGEAGVSHLLTLLEKELDRAMGLAGVSSIEEIGPDLIFNPPSN